MLLIFTLALAQDADAQRILEAYRVARPGDRELLAFKLDWAPSLKDALARAQKESRRIFFIATTQLEDAGSLHSGHC